MDKGSRTIWHYQGLGESPEQVQMLWLEGNGLYFEGGEKLWMDLETKYLVGQGE